MCVFQYRQVSQEEQGQTKHGVWYCCDGSALLRASSSCSAPSRDPFSKLSRVLHAIDRRVGMIGTVDDGEALRGSPTEPWPDENSEAVTSGFKSDAIRGVHGRLGKSIMSLTLEPSGAIERSTSSEPGEPGASTVHGATRTP